MRVHLMFPRYTISRKLDSEDAYNKFMERSETLRYYCRYDE